MRRADLGDKASYRMRLNANDMALKGGKARSVDVPLPLLTDMLHIQRQL
jgi:hypothetical protein